MGGGGAYFGYTELIIDGLVGSFSPAKDGRVRGGFCSAYTLTEGRLS